MAQATVAVQENLPNVQNHLEDAGYYVVSLAPTQNAAPARAEAIVITGGSDDALGREQVHSSVPVIDARGLTPKQVLERLKRHVSP